MSQTLRPFKTKIVLNTTSKYTHSAAAGALYFQNPLKCPEIMSVFYEWNSDVCRPLVGFLGIQVHTKSSMMLVH